MANLDVIITVLLQPYKTKSYQNKLLVKKNLAPNDTMKQHCVKNSAYKNSDVQWNKV